MREGRGEGPGPGQTDPVLRLVRLHKHAQKWRTSAGTFCTATRGRSPPIFQRARTSSLRTLQRTRPSKAPRARPPVNMYIHCSVQTDDRPWVRSGLGMASSRGSKKQARLGTCPCPGPMLFASRPISSRPPRPSSSYPPRVPSPCPYSFLNGQGPRGPQGRTFHRSPLFRMEIDEAPGHSILQTLWVQDDEARTCRDCKVRRASD